MGNGDKVIQTFEMRELLTITTLPLICVYKNPSDYPGKYVARLWDIDKPTNIVALADTYEEILAKKPINMVIMQRTGGDDPVIVEAWI